jgi:hypothetical protein
MIDVWAQSSGVNGSRSYKEGSQEMRAFQWIAQIALPPRETELFNENNKLFFLIMNILSFILENFSLTNLLS